MKAKGNEEKQALALLKISEGLVYPQLEEEWKKTVMHIVKNGTEVNKKSLMQAVTVIKAFNAGKTLKDVQELMSEYPGNRKENVCELVLEFAKGAKGVEFYKKYSTIWYFYVEQDMSISRSNELAEKLTKIQERNQKFEQELNENCIKAR